MVKARRSACGASLLEGTGSSYRTHYCPAGTTLHEKGSHLSELGKSKAGVELSRAQDALELSTSFAYGRL